MRWEFRLPEVIILVSSILLRQFIKSSILDIFNGFINAPHLTFYQRLVNSWDYFTKFMLFAPASIYEIQKAIDRGFGKGKYNVHEALQSASLVFVNNHELIDIARPTSPKFISIGGIAMVPPKTLTGVKICKI